MFQISSNELIKDDALYEKGIEQGMEKGIEQGMEKGMQKGEEKGMEKSARNIAYQMLQEGVPIESIARYTRLSLQEIRKLKDQPPE